MVGLCEGRRHIPTWRLYWIKLFYFVFNQISAVAVSWSLHSSPSAVWIMCTFHVELRTVLAFSRTLCICSKQDQAGIEKSQLHNLVSQMHSVPVSRNSDWSPSCSLRLSLTSSHTQYIESNVATISARIRRNLGSDIRVGRFRMQNSLYEFRWGGSCVCPSRSEYRTCWLQNAVAC